ncbi:MAG TPA: tannase/feruloyl esterase family alpha/beta hydrolase [Acidobacteriaceae bacterium]|nr:tannase/feruloyl esterase family alpha/beta hydrolase [Acidobacteriaceae bacterium]
MLRIACACLLLASPAVALAADCSSLATLQLANTTITLAESVTSGALALPDDGTMLRDLPAFCRIAGRLQPTSDSNIRFEVWLPAQSWNGRLLGVGNGGFAGSIGYRQMAGYLQRGFAVAASDAGHEAEATDASWAWQHPEKVKDFGWRALHLTTLHAKEIITAFYGKPAAKSYFDSCSDGGREALMEAQRFPEDYDGILAGAPANAWSTLLASGGILMHAMLVNPDAYLPDRKLPFIEKAALDKCDTLDGVKDRVIGNPAQCQFNPQTMLCKNGDAASCLTQPQIDAVKDLYAGARDNHGQPVFSGFSMGDETGWRDWITGESPGAAQASLYVENYFRYIATGDSTFNVLNASPDDLLAKSRAAGAADLDATNPDLSQFAARGGKLILYHGWNDPAIPPGNTVAYYESVEKQMGADKTDTFARLYMVPGMEHCLGGPGASTFGQFGIATAKGPKYGLFDSLENWVEKGSPDDAVFATKYAPGSEAAPVTVFTRPLCAWPKVAHYSGSGDTNDAANFSCIAP